MNIYIITNTIVDRETGLEPLFSTQVCGAYTDLEDVDRYLRKMEELEAATLKDRGMTVTSKLDLDNHKLLIVGKKVGEKTTSGYNVSQVDALYDNTTTTLHNYDTPATHQAFVESYIPLCFCNSKNQQRA